MDLPPLVKTISKQQIAEAFVQARKGNISEEQYQTKLDEVLQYIYDCGIEIGMTEALNYVENNADRERLFGGIDELREALDNER